MRGYSLSEVELPANATMIAFGKADGSLMIPDPDESLELGDRIVVLADFGVLGDVRQLIVGDSSRAAPAGGV